MLSSRFCCDFSAKQITFNQKGDSTYESYYISFSKNFVFPVKKDFQHIIYTKLKEYKDFLRIS